MNPACRFSAQQVGKLRSADDLKRSSTNEAAFVKTPVNLPSWGHIAQRSMLFDRGGELRPLAMAKADNADAYKQLPIKRADELAVVVALRNPPDGMRRGFIPRTQLFGSAAAVLRYNFCSRVIVPLACRIFWAPCEGYCGDFGIVTPRCFVSLALRVVTELNEALFVAPKNRKSKAGSYLEFSGLAASSREGGGDVIASLALSKAKIKRRVELVKDTARQDSAAVAELQKLTGELCFTRTGIMDTFGRSALRPFYGLIAKEGGAIPRSAKDCIWWWALVLPTVAPRLVLSCHRKEPADPVRIYSGANGAGSSAVVSFFSCDEAHLPTLVVAPAEQKLQDLEATSNEIRFVEHFAAIAMVFQLRDRLWVEEKFFLLIMKLLAHL